VRVKKILVMMAIMSQIALITASSVAAGAPYEAYTYNYYEDAVPLPEPYLPDKSITGDDLGVGNFKNPNDMYVTKDGTTYILDSGNARVIIADKDWRVIHTIHTFMNEGQEDKFSNPNGIFVSEQKEIYIADTDNSRIVVMTNEGDLLKVVDKPTSDVLPEKFKFSPTKVTVDKANRMFVVARGVYEGLMQFSEKGQFIGYVGTITVTQTFSDRLWRRLATNEQRKRMQLFIPTEFSGLDIDHKGFLYSTNIDMETSAPIKRLNPSGQDVIKRFGYYPNMGDIRFRIFGHNAGPSRLTDIKVLGGGMYTALDSYRGRLFTYNDKGELLHAFGGRGTQLGVFNTPVAVEQLGDKLLVLDRGKSNIVVFQPTLFGKSVFKANALHYEGKDAEAVEVWKDVLRLNSNYDLAYLGIGKALLMEKKNKQAMEYFELGMDRRYYSIAFKSYRREVMQEHFSSFMTGLFTIIIGFVVLRIVKKWRKRRTVNREAGAL